MGFEARLNYLQEFISNVTENTYHIDYETSRYLMFRGMAIVYRKDRVVFIDFNPVLLRPIHTQHAVPMPFPCHAVSLRV